MRSISVAGPKRAKPVVTSDLGADVPVTEAEIELVVAMLGGAEAIHHKLASAHPPRTIAGRPTGMHSAPR